MGRRRAGAAASESTIDTTPPAAEEPVARRSSRLAQKAVVDYNEDRIFQEAFSRAAVPKKAAPRRTKKDKETKMSSKGCVPRVSYLERTTHEIVLTKSKPAPSTNKPARTATMSSLITRASTVLATDQAVSTPVTSRNGAPKAARGGRARNLATVDEASSSNDTASQTSGDKSDRQLLKRVRKPATVTPDTTQEIDVDSLRLRPVKQRWRKEKSMSPDELRVEEGARQPRGTVLFAVEEEEEAMDMDDLLLARPGSPTVVPEKKRKKEATVAGARDTVAPQKDTVAKRAAPRKKRGGRGLSIILERVMREDTVEPQVPPRRADEDDMFAGELPHQGPGALDASLSYLDLYNEGALAIEDIPEEERELCLELGCPPSPTPNLDQCLRSARPLILSTASSPGTSSNNSKSRRRRRTAAGGEGSKRLADLLESESGDEEDEDRRDDPTWAHVVRGGGSRRQAASPSASSTSSRSSSSSKTRRRHDRSFAAEIAEMDASRLRAARYQRSKHVQAAFRNYKGTAAGRKEKESASAAAEAPLARKQWAAVNAPPPLLPLTTGSDVDDDEDEDGQRRRTTVVTAANNLRRDLLPYM